MSSHHEAASRVVALGHGYTALVIVATNNHWAELLKRWLSGCVLNSAALPSAVKAMLQHGAEINCQADDGFAALMMIAAHGDNPSSVLATKSKASNSSASITPQLSVPRHLLNLLTGTLGGLFLTYWWCQCAAECALRMRTVSVLVLLTTMVYHGAHSYGHEQWAERFMKVDIVAVVVGACGLLSSTPPIASFRVCLLLGASLAIWLPSFGPLKGIPHNPILSACHILGILAHREVLAAVC